MKLYHGSKKIVSMPVCDQKNVLSDFGEGFYAAESEELAREWAAADENGGFLNIYELDTEGLKVIDLCSGGHELQEWLAVISAHRVMPLSTSKEASKKAALIKDHLPDLKDADIIKGYRADDSTFSLCRECLKGSITLQKLQSAIKQGTLGEQVLIKTEKALKKLEYIDSDTVDGSIYYPKRMIRDLNVKRSLADLPDEAADASYPAVYLKDAMQTMGELLSYLPQASDTIQADRLLKMFTASGYASRFEKGDPFIISGMSGTELFYRIAEACGEYRYYRSFPDVLSDTGEAFRCGMFLAYYQWKSGLSFQAITNAMSYARLSALYPELSGLSPSEACVIIDSRLRGRRSAQTCLQAQRKRLDLSQRELAASSGVNLRTLQQYEVGDKDINRAAAKKVTALSRTLFCRSEDILEPPRLLT
ncbi:MAG: DUF3990 domain-containing protein [Lachnospiraceae bacterium]|nr:DUF3990 domain-containing protein [Lachnospiraceae bacterium]